MSLEYCYAIAGMGPIPVILFTISAWYIAEHGHQNIAAIDTKVILILTRAEIDSVAHILQGYWKTLLLIYLQHSASSFCKTIGAICLGCYQQQVANSFDWHLWFLVLAIYRQQSWSNEDGNISAILLYSSNLWR